MKKRSYGYSSGTAPHGNINGHNMDAIQRNASRTPETHYRKRIQKPKTRKHKNRICKSAAILLIAALMIAPCQMQTPGDGIRQARTLRNINQMVSSRSPQQQLDRVIGNGLQYSRAITRIASDTPISITTRSQAAENAPRHIQQDMERLVGEGMSYSRAATRAVASDRLPVCMERLAPTAETEAVQRSTRDEGEGIEMWSLNVRGMSTKESLDELEQEAELSSTGILLIQETWRPETKERINIGKWTFFGTGNKERPRGNGTGILVHESIEVESWYHITARITGIRIPYGDKHLTVFSIYAPVQQGRNNSQRTNQFYETLADKTREAKGRGDLVIIGGDWNASIQQHNAPGLIGKWASKLGK